MIQSLYSVVLVLVTYVIIRRIVLKGLRSARVDPVIVRKGSRVVDTLLLVGIFVWLILQMRTFPIKREKEVVVRVNPPVVEQSGTAGVDLEERLNARFRKKQRELTEENRRAIEEFKNLR